MKKILCVTLAILMLLALCACGDNGNTTTTQPADDDKALGYTFTYNGKQFGLNMKMTDVIALIGQPTKSNSSDSCAFAGKDTVYYYSDDIRITTSDDRGYEWIYEITLTNDLVETEEGIYIGSSAADVTAKYGTSEGSSDALLTYTKDGMKLMFVIDNGVVTRIRYTML